MSLSQEKIKEIKELREGGSTYREIAKKSRVNPTQIKEALEGKPDPLKGELSSLQPHLVQLMRVSGEMSVKAGITSSIIVHKSINKVSLDRGFTTTEQYIEFTDGRDKIQHEEILRLKEVLSSWQWEGDQELADMIGIDKNVMWRFARAQLKNPNLSLVGYLNYIVASYYKLLKLAEVRDSTV